MKQQHCHLEKQTQLLSIQTYMHTYIQIYIYNFLQFLLLLFFTNTITNTQLPLFRKLFFAIYTNIHSQQKYRSFLKTTNQKLFPKAASILHKNHFLPIQIKFQRNTRISAHHTLFFIYEKIKAKTLLFNSYFIFYYLLFLFLIYYLVFLIISCFLYNFFFLYIIFFNIFF